MREPGPIPWRDPCCGWYSKCLDRAARADGLFDCTDCRRYHAGELSLTDVEVAGCRALAAWILRCDPAMLGEGIAGHSLWGHDYQNRHDSFIFMSTKR